MTVALLNRRSRFGDIRPVRFRGSGGFSDVYEAFDSRGRRVALKVLRTSFHDAQRTRDRFDRERQILAKVDSRSVARLINADFEHDPPWIASEYIDGPSLREAISQSGPLTPAAAVGLIAHLISTISEIHQQGISHRDLTPSNIIIGPDGPVLIDFGAAHIDQGFGDTGTQMSIGTPAYASPEQLNNEPVGMASDVYALAQIFKFVTTGSDPSSGVVEIEGLDDDAKDLILAASLRNPGDRPTIFELLNVFTRPAEVDLRLTNSAYESPRLRKLPRKYGLPAVVLIASTIAVVTGLVAFMILQVDQKPLSAFDLIKETAGLDTTTGVMREIGIAVSAEVFIPKGWEIERQRPVQTYRSDISYVTTVDSYAATGDNGRLEFTTQIINKSQILETSALLNRKQNFLTLGGEVQAFFDQHVDQFESVYAPNGCLFRRSETALVQEGATSFVALVATTNQCVINTEGIRKSYFAFVGHVYLPKQNAVLVVEGNRVGGAFDLSEFFKRLKVAGGTPITKIPAELSLSKPFRLGKVDEFKIPSSKDYLYYQGRLFLEALDQNKSFRIRSIGSQETSMSFYGINRNDKWQLVDQQYYPLGRSQFTDANSEEIVLGATKYFDIVVVEFETWGKIRPTFEVTSVGRQKKHKMLDLSAYKFDGATVAEDITNQNADEWHFGLPLGGELSEGVDLHDFAYSQVSIPKNWIVVNLVEGAEWLGFNANPNTDYLRSLEVDESQMNLYGEQTAAVIARDDGLWNVRDNPALPCVASSGFETKIAGWKIVWRTHHGCEVLDSFNAYGENPTQKQMNPIIYFYVAEEDSDGPTYRGFYSPQGMDSIGYWEKVASEILEAARR
jgi:serine/threonine protein kinase